MITLEEPEGVAIVWPRLWLVLLVGDGCAVWTLRGRVLRIVDAGVA